MAWNWIWPVCLLITVCFLVLAARNLLTSSKNSFIKIVKGVLFLAGASFVLYIPVYFLQNNFLTALAADTVNVLQVMSLDSDYLAQKEFITGCLSDGAFYRVYMAVLGLVHILMPMISLIALYSILFKFYSHIRVMSVNLYGKRPVYVFNELNQRTARLAKDIQKNGAKGSFIFAGVSESEQNKEKQDLNSVIAHPDDVRNIHLKRKAGKEVYYFFLAADDNKNINDALDLISVLSKYSSDIQKETHVYVESAFDETESLLDSSAKGCIDISILKAEEKAVYRLIDEHPLYENAQNRSISVLVIGLDSMGTAFVKAACWCGQLLGYKLKINVAGVGIERQIEDFKFRYPGLIGSPELKLNFFNCSGEGELFEVIRTSCADTTYAVVSQGTDMEVTETAIGLRREFLKADRTYTAKPQIYAYIRNPDQAKVLERLKTSELSEKRRVSYEITSFGSEEEIYSYKTVLDSDEERLSRNIHLVYEDITRAFYDSDTPDIDVPAALASYNLLEVNKRSNRANAIHIRYKLALMGLDYVRETEEEEVDFETCLTEEYLEKLTIAEHDRWMMFLLSEGWMPAELSDVEAYKKSGISAGRHNCPLMKMHPYICPFDELPARSEALGLGDSTVYDRELIRRIPQILHDRWAVSGIRYKIVRRKP